MQEYKPDMNIRQMIICSTLSERPLLLEHIRVGTERPGLYDFELNLLNLISQITNGSRIEVDEKRAALFFFPGIVTNNDGDEFSFDCGNVRSITYFLEALIPIALFGKAPLRVTLKGITNDGLDLSIDSLAGTMPPLLRRFGVEGDLLLKTEKRGFVPHGGGSVKVRCPTVKMTLNAVELLEEGKFKRIRGVAYGASIHPQFLNDMTSAAKKILNDYSLDVWLTNDLSKAVQKDAQGYGISLVAESLKGTFISADDCFDIDKGRRDPSNEPEALGRRCALRLLDELGYGGFLDTHLQSTALLLAALSERKISRLKLGRISNYTVAMLRNIRDYFGVVFNIKAEEMQIESEVPSRKNSINVREEDGENENENENGDAMEEEESKQVRAQRPPMVIFSCIGMGLANLSRKVH
eukprot:TRINITY_DN4055_c0_g4_i1.p1 TRINITY_DN4055_c0_g4~~TRINITY_DN4055_c0_g4_i1.p1  ORF type:complete len:410 (-),score=131.98 TRINITY_DN4055_c0_g4_i1:138-1367(-)